MVVEYLYRYSINYDFKQHRMDVLLLDKTELNLIEIINMMLRRWWLIIMLTLTGAIVAFMYTDFFMVPMYKTDGSLYVNCETETIEIDETASAGKLNSNSRLAQTYVEILKRRSFLSGVAADMGNKYTYNRLRSMITITPINETELLEITVTGTNPEEIAEILANILTRAEEELIRVVNAGSVVIVDNPEVPDAPFSPNKTKNVLIGAVIGLVLSLAAILWLEIFDTKIKNPDQIKNAYEEPLLGEIPSLEED